MKYDETFQKNVETYRNALTILVPVEQAGAEFRLVVTSQGCADAGLCYPPMQSAAAIGLTGFGGAGTARVEPPGVRSAAHRGGAARAAAPTAAEATGSTPCCAAARSGPSSAPSSSPACCSR